MGLNEWEQCLAHGEFPVIVSKSIKSNRNVRALVMVVTYPFTQNIQNFHSVPPVVQAQG